MEREVRENEGRYVSMLLTGAGSLVETQPIALFTEAVVGTLSVSTLLVASMARPLALVNIQGAWSE